MALKRIAMVGALALATTACGNITERLVEGALERAAGGDVDINLDSDSGSITVETTEGTMRFGAGGEMPGSFPDDIPLPSANYRVAQSFDGSSGDGIGVQVTLMVDAAPEGIAEELEDAFTAGGWELDAINRMSGDDFAHVTMSFMKGDVGVLLMIMSGDDEQTIVAYTVGNDG